MNQAISTDTDTDSKVCKSNEDSKLIFSYEEALSASVEYFDGDELAAKVFIDKYAMRDNDMNLVEKTPYDMHVRIAKEFARIEKNKFKNPMTFDEIFSYIDHFKYIVPQGSPMYGIGNKYQTVSVGNCFCLDSPYDSYCGILKTDEELVQISKRRGGVGIDISTLRPSGAKTHNAAHTSTGVPSFMERYSNSIREVGQNGRRGALMISISVHHPDIEDFISIKSDLTKITGANISIRVSDKFLNAVENDEEYELSFPVDSDDPQFSEMISAKYIWDKIIEANWKCVSYDTKIDVYKNGVLNRCSIGDFYREYHDSNLRDKYEIMSLNLQTLKTERKEIEDAQEYNNNKTTFKIKIGSSEIETTEDHIFYVLNPHGDLESKPIGDIQIGEKIAFAKTCQFGVSEHINLETCLDVFCDNGFSLSGEYMSKALDKVAVKNAIGKYPHGYKTTEYKRQGIFPVKDYIQHRKIIGTSPLDTSLTLARSKTTIPLAYPLTQELCEFLGLFLAEGSYSSQGCVRLHIHKDEEKQYKNILDWISNEFNCNYSSKIEDNYCCIHINCSFLKRLIVGIGLKKHLQDKAIPEFIFDLKEEYISAFLRGLFSGDGTASNGGVVSLSQSNKRIIEDVSNLLLKFGIHCNIRHVEKAGTKIICGKKCNIKDGYGLYIFSKFGKTFKERIGFIQDKKTKKINCMGDSAQFGIPVLLDKTFIKKEMKRWEETQYIKLSSLKNHSKLTENKNIDKFIKSDIYYLELKSKEEIVDINKVYDITVRDNHTFLLSNGMIISNSAEPGVLLWDNIINESPADCYAEDGFKTITTNPCGELPLPAAESCRLLLLNLFSYVDNPFTSKAKFDFDKFYEHSNVAQRLMDDLIDIEIECVEKIIKKIKNDPEPADIKIRELNLWKNVKDMAQRGRRTGTGTTALGDTLAALGIPYASRKGLNAVEKIYRTLKLGSYRSSVDMARGLGHFEVWDHEKEKKNPFLLRIKDEDPSLYRDMKKYGRRNIALLTIAPAGSVSLLTQTSSGIEPQFMIEPYTRRKKGNPGDENFRSDFVDQSGDHWMEFQVFPPKVKMWMEVTGETDVDKSPWRGSTAAELDWRQRVQLQSLAQKNIDHSISSTTNLPSDATIEDVDEIYRTAWKSGCKGITIYRDGCRTGVLVSNEDGREGDNDTIPQTEAPKRKKDLPCEVHHTKVRGVPYFVVVGLLNGEPYEVFAGINHINGHSVEGDDPEEIVIPRPFRNGIIRKEKRGHYNAILNSKSNTELTIMHIGQRISDDEAALTRLISTSLRHGAAINFVVHQLEKVTGDLTSFGKSIARALKKYIPDGTEVTGEECPNCVIKENTIIRQEGCILCKKCGWSKCG